MYNGNEWLIINTSRSNSKLMKLTVMSVLNTKNWSALLKATKRFGALQTNVLNFNIGVAHKAAFDKHLGSQGLKPRDHREKEQYL